MQFFRAGDAYSVGRKILQTSSGDRNEYVHNSMDGSETLAVRWLN